MIWDGRVLNEACAPAPAYKMETLKRLKYLARKGDYMLSADIQDGFHALGIYPGHRRYMTFQVGACIFAYNVLPFGWSHSPSCFMRLTEVLVRAFRVPDLPHGKRGSNLEFLSALRAG